MYIQVNQIMKPGIKFGFITKKWVTEKKLEIKI